MEPIGDRQADQAAYRRLKPTIDRKYPHGRFVAILDGRIVADGASFDELTATLGVIGENAKQVLVVQAGVEYPQTATIFVYDLRS